MVKLSIDNIIDNTECTSQQLQSTSSCLANTPAITKHGLRQKYWKHDLNNIIPKNGESQVIVTRVFIKVIEYYEHSFLSRLVGDYDAFNIFGFYIISITIQ